MKKKMYVAAILAGICGCFMLSCAIFPVVANFWLMHVMGRMTEFVAGISARVSFPLTELLAAGCVLGIALGFVRAMLRRHRWHNMIHWLANTLLLVVFLFAAYVFLWYPAYFAPDARPYAIGEVASQEELAALCDGLIDALNISAPGTEDFDALMEMAWDGVSALEELPYAGTAAVKAARYPEWMSAAGIAGIYVPHLAEALVYPEMDPVAVAFTICHELSHRSGLADEGQANVAAYRACMHLGGTFQYSARLWALKYAMAELRQRDESAWWQALDRMQDALRVRFAVSVGGYAMPAQQGGWLVGLLGIGRAVGSYADLTDYLISTGNGFSMDLRNIA